VKKKRFTSHIARTTQRTKSGVRDGRPVEGAEDKGVLKATGEADAGFRLTARSARAELGLPAPPAHVTTAAVRRAFRKGALRCHPDKVGDTPAAASRFLRLHSAYRFLTEGWAECAGPDFTRNAADTYDGDGFFSEDGGDLAYDPILVRSVLFQSLGGELSRDELEALLRGAGVHRPPSDFGSFPYPRFKDLPRLRRRDTFDGDAGCDPLFTLRPCPQNIRNPKF